MHKSIKPLHAILPSKWTPLLPAQSVKICSLGRAPAVSEYSQSCSLPDQWEMGRMQDSIAK